MKHTKSITLLILWLFGLIACDSTDSKTTGSFTDARDNKTYKTVKIGNQWWMAENLVATKFNDGTEISFIIKNEEWNTLETPGFSWYNNEKETYKDYGILYNWYAIVCCDICPSGWRVPTDEDWKILEKELGLTIEEASSFGIRGSNVGGMLKSKTFWNPPNVDGTNKSGFNGLPEGHRNWKSGDFVDIGFFGTWWSATELDSVSAWRRTLHFNDSNIRRMTSHKRDGFSVRCVKK